MDFYSANKTVITVEVTNSHLPRRRRFKVIFFSDIGWVSYKRWLESLDLDQAKLLVPAC